MAGLVAIPTHCTIQPAELGQSAEAHVVTMKTQKRRAVSEMKVGPSKPPCRGRLQTAISCFGQKPRW
jgi:hypothetical protein